MFIFSDRMAENIKEEQFEIKEDKDFKKEEDPQLEFTEIKGKKQFNKF